MRFRISRPLGSSLPFWLALCALELYASRALAGNDDGILIGGQASLVGGAVTATVSDGSAAWYNPAGIAHIKEQTLDINASVYGVGLVTAKPFVTIDGEDGTDARTTDWQLIPSALSYARQINPKLVAAFSIIIPKTTDYDMRTSATEPSGVKWNVGVDQLRNEYDYILSFGWRLTDRLRLGFSVHGIYISTEKKVQLARGEPGVDGTPFTTYADHAKLGDYGLRLGFGMQWTLSRNLELGFAIQSYTLTGYRSTLKSTFASVVSEDAPSKFDSVEQDKMKGVWELSTPLAARVGAAYRIGNTQISVDGSVYTPLDSEEDDLDRKVTGNARLACLVDLSEKLSFGLGAFTDLSGATSAVATNFAGLAGGVRLAQRYHIVEGNRVLLFLTTLSVRYAYGWGHSPGIVLHGDERGSFDLTTVPVTVHEMAFNLGGGVSF